MQTVCIVPGKHCSALWPWGGSGSLTTRPGDSLGSGDDLLQALEGVILCFLSAGHGALDGRLLSIDVGKKEADLRSHVRLVGILGKKATAGLDKNAPDHFGSTEKALGSPVGPRQCQLTLGSCTNAPPLDPGGSSPDVAYLRHSIIV